MASDKARIQEGHQGAHSGFPLLSNDGQLKVSNQSKAEETARCHTNTL